MFSLFYWAGHRCQLISPTSDYTTYHIRFDMYVTAVKKAYFVQETFPWKFIGHDGAIPCHGQYTPYLKVLSKPPVGQA